MSGGTRGDVDYARMLASALQLASPGPRDLADLDRMVSKLGGNDNEIQSYCDGLIARPSDREALLNELADARAIRAADDRTMAVLERTALPLLVLDHARSGKASIRIWTPDASPMLPYRVAVALLELLNETRGDYSVKVLVTGKADETERSIGHWDVTGSEGRLDKYFLPAAGGYMPVPELVRALERSSGTARRPPSDVDLVIVPPFQGNTRSGRTFTKYSRGLRHGSLLISSVRPPSQSIPGGILEPLADDDSLYRWSIEAPAAGTGNH